MKEHYTSFGLDHLFKWNCLRSLMELLKTHSQLKCKGPSLDSFFERATSQKYVLL